MGSWILSKRMGYMYYSPDPGEQVKVPLGKTWKIGTVIDVTFPPSRRARILFHDTGQHVSVHMRVVKPLVGASMDRAVKLGPYVGYDVAANPDSMRCNCESILCPWHGETVEGAGRSRACPFAPSEIKALYVGYICDRCAAFMPKEYLFPPHGTARRNPRNTNLIEELRAIASSGTSGIVQGVRVDCYTAGLVVGWYDRAGPNMKRTMERLPVAHLCWAAVKYLSGNGDQPRAA